MKISDIVSSFLNLLTKGFIPAIISLGLLYFIWGLVKYLTSAGDASKRSEGVKVMLNGVIGLTIMVTVWAIVGLISNLIGSPVGIPQF